MLPLIARYFDVTIDELFEPDMRAYANQAERLMVEFETDISDSETFAAAYNQINDYNSAIQIAGKGLELFPDNAILLVHSLALYFINSGDKERAQVNNINQPDGWFMIRYCGGECYADDRDRCWWNQYRCGIVK